MEYRFSYPKTIKKQRLDRDTLHGSTALVIENMAYYMKICVRHRLIPCKLFVREILVTLKQQKLLPLLLVAFHK